MTKTEELLDLANKVAEAFQLTVDILYDKVLSLKTQSKATELCRMIYSPEGDTFGMCFQVETVATDAIQIFSVARNIKKEVNLLQCFYQNSVGEVFLGPEAQMMSIHDRENNFLKSMEERTKVQQEQDFQMREIQRIGKVNLH